MMRSVLAAFALSLAAVGHARAQSCNVTISPMTFGVYNPFSASPLDSTGNVRVACSSSFTTSVSYSIQISAGGSGGTSQRSMAGPGPRLGYQLYRDLARSTIWGDGTDGNMPIMDTYPLLQSVPVVRDYAIYGRITPGLQVTPGAYTDLVTVIVTY